MRRTPTVGDLLVYTLGEWWVVDCRVRGAFVLTPCDVSMDMFLIWEFPLCKAVVTAGIGSGGTRVGGRDLATEIRSLVIEMRKVVIMIRISAMS